MFNSNRFLCYKPVQDDYVFHLRTKQLQLCHVSCKTAPLRAIEFDKENEYLCYFMH